jgi:two-component system OmpR family response regulator
MRVLIIDDDRGNADSIATGLESAGHGAAIVGTGRQGITLAIERGFDAIVLDRMLPDLDGLSVVALMRAEGLSTPVLFLSVLSGLDDRVQGLRAGGDDYLMKPFEFEELVARLEALARRSALGSTRLSAGDLEMDLLKRAVRRGGELIELRPREFRLLETLLRSDGRVVTRRMLLERVFQLHFDPKTKIVETHMSRLRAKLERGRNDPLIYTTRGAGYALRAAAATH